MLVLNNKKFALNDKEFTNTLFEDNGTAIGYYKVLKRQIKLFDMQKNLIGIITNNVLAKATLQNNGKYWYSYSTPGLIGDYESYTKEREDISKAMELLNK